MFVKEDELDPNFRLLEDLLLHLNSVRDKMKLIEQVMAYLADCTAVPETLQTHPNAICVWMRRNVSTTERFLKTMLTNLGLIDWV